MISGSVSHEGSVSELYRNPATPELMQFLGPGNWFTPEDARVWLGTRADGARCFRPEQIIIEPCADGRFVVVSARFMGSFAECELSGKSGTPPRLFYHRPSMPVLAPNMRVSICLR